MTPWDMKRQIDTAFIVADRYGFELREESGGYGYAHGPIFLFAKADNTVFAKEMVLNSFERGYEKADIAAGMENARRKK